MGWSILTMYVFYYLYIYTMRNVFKEFVDEKFARLENQFNPDALSNSADDDSYAGEEPGMSFDTADDADSVITNTGINPLEFIDEDEEFVNDKWEVIKFDKQLWTKVKLLHEQANKFKQTPEITEDELEKRDEIESNEPHNPHYRLMEVKYCDSTNSVRRFYRNGTEWYETWNEQWKWVTQYNDDPSLCYIEEEQLRYEENKKKVIPILYKRLGESRRWMKLAALQKKRQLYREFKAEFTYCSTALDAINKAKQEKKLRQIKRRKDRLYTNWIKYSNLWGKLTINDVKEMINNKSLAYAEKVIEKWLSGLLPVAEQQKHCKFKSTY